MTTAAELTVESLQTQLIERDQKILYLEEQLAWFTRQIFGKKSERLVDTDPEQLKFDGFESEESAKAETKTIPSHERRTKNRSREDTISLPDDLPVETIVIGLPEEETICKETGVPLQKIGEEVSHKLADLAVFI